jgi:hypothetical protein
VSGSGRDLYALLGVAPDVDAREIARAYRRRLREVHPDTRDRLSAGPDPAHADLRALPQRRWQRASRTGVLPTPVLVGNTLVSRRRRRRHLRRTAGAPPTTRALFRTPI